MQVGVFLSLKMRREGISHIFLVLLESKFWLEIIFPGLILLHTFAGSENNDGIVRHINIKQLLCMSLNEKTSALKNDNNMKKRKFHSNVLISM